MRIPAQILPIAAAIVLFAFATAPAHAQKSLADDLILLSKAKQQQDQMKAHQHLATPGKGESPFPMSPGANVPRLGEPVPVSAAPPPSLLNTPFQRPGEGTPPPRISATTVSASQKVMVHAMDSDGEAESL